MSQLPTSKSNTPAQNGKQSTMPEPSLIAPETYGRGSVDYNAFGGHLAPGQADKLSSLLPRGVVHEIQDQSSVEIRRAAISTIQKTINETDDKDLLQGGLNQILTVVVQALSDSNFKVVLTALELVDDLISKVGPSLLPYLPLLLSNYLSKVGSHKNMVKQAGMKVLMNLMRSLTPAPVINEIINVGLAHKQAKVREESLNIVIASLLTFPRSEFELHPLMQSVVTLLVDPRTKVREACLEACAVLADRLGKDQLQLLVSAVVNVERSAILTGQDGVHLNLMLAFQTRLSRNQLPSLNEHGLVDHVVSVSNGNGKGRGGGGGGGTVLTGSDVDWILAGKGASPGMTSRKTSGPLKSAGRKMPWESPSKEQMQITATGYNTTGYATGYTGSGTGYTTSYTGSGTGYATSYTGSGTGYTTGYTGIGTSYASLSMKQQVQSVKPLPSGFTPTKASKGYLDIYRMSQEVKLRTVKNTTQNSSESTLSDSLSTTWPRQNGHSNTMLTQTSRHISAESTSLGGNLIGTSKHSGVLPAIGSSRPLSKPIVRNPLNFHPQLPPPTSPPLAKSRSDSPSQIEQDFLGNGGVNMDDDDDEYFNNIPVDDSQLNCSLSSSLTSLLIGSAKETNDRQQPNGITMDSLSQIRKKAANLKAEFLSTQCSAATSPDSTPPLSHSHKFAFSTSRPEKNAVVSAPVNSSKKESPLKKRNSPMKAPPLQPLLHNSKSLEDDPSLSYQTKRGTSEGLLYDSKPKQPMKSRQSKTLFTSPPKKDPDSLLTPPLLPIRDLELYPDSPNKQPPVIEETERNLSFPKKKPSPTKSISAPQKPSLNSPVGGVISNSAPVYRPAHVHETLLEEDEEEEGSSDLVELSDLPHPESALKRAQQGLASGGEEWEEKCEALLLLRRLAACHLDVLVPHLQTILIDVEREVKNVRSTVARSAIACLADMFSFAGKYMEPSVDTITKTLLHVGSKANVFYREDAQKTLTEMCHTISPTKTLQALINGGLNHSSHLIRRQVAQFMCVIIEYWEPVRIMRLPRDVLEKTIIAISLLLEDADPLARYQARKMLYRLSSSPEFDTIASRSLSEQQHSKMRDTMESLKLKGLGKPPLDSQSAKTTRLSLSTSFTGTAPGSNTPHSPPKTRRRRISTPLTETEPSNTLTCSGGILERMKGSDWKERQDAITQLGQLVKAHPNSLGPQIIKIFDVFNERLNDNNSKVNLHALQTFQKIIPLISHQLQPVLATVVEVLAGTVASRYTTIHSAAVDAIDTLIDHVDCTLLFPLFVSAAQNGNTRVQPIMLQKLADLIPKVHDQKPTLVVRTALPVLWKILGSRSPATGEAKMSVVKLCEVLHSCLGPELVANGNQLAPSQRQKLQELLDIVSSQNR